MREYFTIAELLNNEHMKERSGRMDSPEQNRQDVSLFIDDQLSANRIGILKVNQDQIFMVEHYFHPHQGLWLLEETLDQIL
jgi:hypothetical protein